jgi:serine/threonine-protein kinase HipA
MTTIMASLQLHDNKPPVEVVTLDAVVRDGDDVAAVKALLDAGTASLGGARPKAYVRDGDTLHIAKFSRPGDQWNVML